MLAILVSFGLIPCVAEDEIFHFETEQLRTFHHTLLSFGKDDEFELKELIEKFSLNQEKAKVIYGGDSQPHYFWVWKLDGGYLIQIEWVEHRDDDNGAEKSIAVSVETWKRNDDQSTKYKRLPLIWIRGAGSYYSMRNLEFEFDSKFIDFSTEEAEVEQGSAR